MYRLITFEKAGFAKDVEFTIEADEIRINDNTRLCEPRLLIFEAKKRPDRMRYWPSPAATSVIKDRQDTCVQLN